MGIMNWKMSLEIKIIYNFMVVLRRMSGFDCDKDLLRQRSNINQKLHNRKMRSVFTDADQRHHQYVYVEQLISRDQSDNCI